MTRKPADAGMLILPAGVFVAAAVFSTVLLWDAIEIASSTYTQSEHRFVREQLASEMTAALAGSLGLTGSLVVAGVLFVAASVWLVRSVRDYRARVREDRQALAPRK